MESLNFLLQSPVNPHPLPVNENGMKLNLSAILISSTCTHTHTHTHTHTDTHTHTHTHTHTDTYAHVYPHTHMDMHVHTHTHLSDLSSGRNSHTDVSLFLSSATFSVDDSTRARGLDRVRLGVTIQCNSTIKREWTTCSSEKRVY